MDYSPFVGISGGPSKNPFLLQRGHKGIKIKTESLVSPFFLSSCHIRSASASAPASTTSVFFFSSWSFCLVIIKSADTTSVSSKGASEAIPSGAAGRRVRDEMCSVEILSCYCTMTAIMFAGPTAMLDFVQHEAGIDVLLFAT